MSNYHDIWLHDLMVGGESCSLAAAAPLAASDVVSEMGHQLTNMAMLYVLIALLNKRARQSGDNAARQVGWGNDVGVRRGRE